MNTKTIAIFSITPLFLYPSIAQANVITADSQVWVNEGATVELGASYRQSDINYLKPVQKTREVHVPSVSAYEYIDAHGRVVCVPEVPGYSYHETYTAYDQATKTVSKTQGNTKVTTRAFGNDFAVSVGLDGNLYGGAAIKNGSAVLSGTINTQGHYNATLAFSPFKNTALIANLNKDFTSYGIQQQINQGSILVAYSPSNRDIVVGFGMELGNTPVKTPEVAKEVVKQAPVTEAPVIDETPEIETPLIDETPEIETPLIDETPVIETQPATLPGSKFIRGRG